MTGGEPDDFMSAALGEDDSVTCRVCGRPLGRITYGHVAEHGMDLDDYREEFPEAPLTSGDTLARSGVDSHDDDTKEKISKAIQEKHESGDYE